MIIKSRMCIDGSLQRGLYYERGIVVPDGARDAIFIQSTIAIDAMKHRDVRLCRHAGSVPAYKDR